MFNSSKLCLCIIFWFSFLSLQSQECNLSVKGITQDAITGQKLPFVNVLLKESNKGTISNEDGSFSFDKLCARHYHFVFSHIGCDPVQVHLDLQKDSTLQVFLAHHTTSLKGVDVTGNRPKQDQQPVVVISRQTIEDRSNKNLAGLLEDQSGIHLIKNGNGIAKPVVQGLYGNRLTILNNGIVQSGQQWGNDHSPEIDPFSADKITVIKGVSALSYSGGSMGSAILIEPSRIGQDPHLHGQIGYLFESNGRGHTMNIRLQKYSPKIAWRLSGSLKKYGDKKAATYFLNNSGTEEGNLSIQLEKSWKDKIKLEVYGSTFNTRLGILRGSQIGNLTDLLRAFNRQVPFYTEEEFSYQIQAPKQHVSHHFLKLKTSYYFSDKNSLETIVAAQLNKRKEFDIRRGGRSIIPSLSLAQITLNAELKYTHDFQKNLQLKLGHQTIITDNTNNPETGILPLIPDYSSIQSGVYAILTKKLKKVLLDLGGRYDYTFQNVAAISNSLPRRIENYNNNFHGVTGFLSLSYSLSPRQSIGLNTGYAMRNPAINELFSRGLHQGVGGIEEGDINLEMEKAIKNTLSYKYLPNEKFSFEAVAFAQYFQNYIYLNPEDKVRLTIRGAFPLFSYKQTSALIYGVDLSTTLTFAKSFYSRLNYSFIRGKDTGINAPLVFIPPNSFFGSLSYRVKKRSTTSIIEDIEFEVSNRYVFRQNYLNADQDFVAPPPGYNLLGAKISANISSSKVGYRLFVQVENMLNASYRDYLNRQRYFADDLGISFTLGAQLKF